MNTQARRRKVNIGIAYLAEAILDVIQDEGIKTDGKVSTTKINDVLEFTPTEWKKDMCRAVLEHMEENSEIVSVSGASWRLAN